VLHRHALESVFAFLNQGELAVALQVSRGWLAAAQSMASLQLEVGPPSASVSVVAASAMGRHVAVLGHDYERVSLDTDALSVVARLMPHLRGLFCVLGPPPPGEPLSFPASLRELEIDQRGPVSAAELNDTLTAVGRLSRLESLLIMLPARTDPQISFAPLAALPQLRILRIYWSADGSLSDAHLDELRAMPRLHRLTVSKMNPETLRRLLRQPHDLQWKDISLPKLLDDDTAALLPQLPSLTKIDVTVSCELFGWLRGLPNLARVDLTFAQPVGAEGRVPSLISGLGSGSNIEFLSLIGCADLTAAQLAELLPRLPRLRELMLAGLPIDSLSFLAQPPLTDQLSELSLDRCHDLPLIELHHVHRLRGLKQLALWGSFTESMDGFCQSLYEPPSLLLPRLEKFQYLSPSDDAQDED
jgi:hypothetical protein